MSPLDRLLLSLAGCPALPGARCRNRAHLFDEAGPHEDPDVVSQRQAQAIELCARCPSLTRCGDWLNSLPKRKRPAGVVAGRINVRA